MKSSELVNLMFSPQWVAKLLHHFLTGSYNIDPKGIKTELLYLSLPFIIDDVTRKKLLRANSRSTFASLFLNDGSLEMKNALVIKNHQINQYRDFINKGLIYLGNIVPLEIGSSITTGISTRYLQEQNINRNYCKVAYYLGIVLAKEDYRNIFVKLGVTNI